MKIRCLLLTGSVAILRYTASQLSECVGLVQAHRLLDDPAAAPPQTYYIDQEGQLQTVEDEERRKAQASAEKQRKDKGEKLTQARAGFKAQMEKFSKSLAREDFESALTMKTELIESENVAKEELDKVEGIPPWPTTAESACWKRENRYSIARHIKLQNQEQKNNG